MSFAELIAASQNQQPSAEKTGSSNKKTTSSPLRTPSTGAAAAVHGSGDSGLYGHWGAGRGGKTERSADSSIGQPVRKRPNGSLAADGERDGSPVNLNIFRGAGNSLAKSSNKKAKQKEGRAKGATVAGKRGVRATTPKGATLGGDERGEYGASSRRRQTGASASWP